MANIPPPLSVAQACQLVYWPRKLYLVMVDHHHHEVVAECSRAAQSKFSCHLRTYLLPSETFSHFHILLRSTSILHFSFFFSLCRERCRSRQCSSSDKLFNFFVLFNHAGRGTFYCLHLHLRARITRFVSIHQPPPETFTPSHSPQASFFVTRIRYLQILTHLKHSFVPRTEYLQIHNNALRKGGRRSGTGCPYPGGSSTFVDRGIKTYR